MSAMISPRASRTSSTRSRVGAPSGRGGGGRAEWQGVLESFWKDFKPRTDEVMEQKPSEVTAALDLFLEPYLFPAKADGGDPRLCPVCGTGQLALRGGKFGAFVACSNYPDCKFTRRFGQPGGEEGEGGGNE